MNILIIGAGLSGCSLGRILKDRGHEVQIIERNAYLGGLCITREDPNGIKYEPFGARTFHSRIPRVIEFVKKFDDFNGYVHRKGVIVNNILFPFPLTRNSLDNFEDKELIIEELILRPEEPDCTNFETACISLFGKTLYKYFIENYTKKMWGLEPKELTADWASKRLEFRDEESDELFKDQWQGLPINGYSTLLERMAEGITVKFNTTDFSQNEFDVIACTAPIDALFDFKYGKLPYRSLRFYYQYDNLWENNLFGTINLPQHHRFIRKCNFKILHRQKSEINYIQYQEPIPAKDADVPMYPINTKSNDSLYEKYLHETCYSRNICPSGRLGLYKYLDMDKAIDIAFSMMDLIENYLEMPPDLRLRIITDIRNK